MYLRFKNCNGSYRQPDSVNWNCNSNKCRVVKFHKGKWQTLKIPCQDKCKDKCRGKWEWDSSRLRANNKWDLLDFNSRGNSFSSNLRNINNEHKDLRLCSRQILASSPCCSNKLSMSGHNFVVLGQWLECRACIHKANLRKINLANKWHRLMMMSEFSIFYDN